MAKDDVQSLILEQLKQLNANMSRFEDKFNDHGNKIAQNAEKIISITSNVDSLADTVKAMVIEMREDRKSRDSEVDEKLSVFQTFIDTQRGFNERKKDEWKWIAGIGSIILAIGGVLYVSYTGDLAIHSVAEIMGGKVSDLSGLIRRVENEESEIEEIKKFIVPAQ